MRNDGIAKHRTPGIVLAPMWLQSSVEPERNCTRKPDGQRVPTPAVPWLGSEIHPELYVDIPRRGVRRRCLSLDDGSEEVWRIVWVHIESRGQNVEVIEDVRRFEPHDRLHVLMDREVLLDGRIRCNGGLHPDGARREGLRRLKRQGRNFQPIVVRRVGSTLLRGWACRASGDRGRSAGHVRKDTPAPGADLLLAPVGFTDEFVMRKRNRVERQRRRFSALYREIGRELPSTDHQVESPVGNVYQFPPADGQFINPKRLEYVGETEVIRALLRLVQRLVHPPKLFDLLRPDIVHTE